MDRAIEIRKRKVKTLLFDLDNTIYPQSCGLLNEIGRRIRLYIKQLFNISEEQANKLATDYRWKYGSSLMGLVYIEKIDPVAYRDFVYDIEYEKFISKDRKIIDLMNKLPQEKIIYTNASRKHAEAVLNIMGISNAFKMIVPVEDVYFYAKPTPQSFREMLIKTKIHPSEAIFLDDQPANIITGKSFGIGTILIGAEHKEADLCINELTDLQA